MTLTFTNSWFEQSAKNVWDVIIPQLKVKTILEIGSYEGKSLCYLIDHFGDDSDLEIHSVDTWDGGKDHVSPKINAMNPMSEVEARFHQNTSEAIASASCKIDLRVHKGSSDMMLADLLCGGPSAGGVSHFEYFDFIYVDGSHETTDTLCDLVLSMRMLKKGGMMIVDDYLWYIDAQDNFRPKLAIDAFVNLHFHQMNIINAPNFQVYLVKRTGPVEAMK